MPVKLPDKKTWARFADSRGYPIHTCDECGEQTRIFHRYGCKALCEKCFNKKVGT